MILIIGGAYQGKLDFAMRHFGIGDSDVFSCTGTQIDFSKPCIVNLEEFVRHCLQQGVESVDYFRGHRALWQQSILICRDISCGVVPMEREERQWRQATGRLCQYLAGEAEQVSRIFCGLEQRLKDTSKKSY